jgi:hypothetical protein
MKKFTIIRKIDNKFVAIDLFHEIRKVQYDNMDSCLNLCRMRVGKSLETANVFKVPFFNIWIIS